MKKLPLSLILLLSLAAPIARADLVGLYTFDGANPLEAVIGSPAKEGVSSGDNQAATLTDTMSTLSMVSDAAVLAGRTGVIAVPSYSTLAVPNPGLQKNWTIAFWFYAPARSSSGATPTSAHNPTQRASRASSARGTSLSSPARTIRRRFGSISGSSTRRAAGTSPACPCCSSRSTTTARTP